MQTERTGEPGARSVLRNRDFRALFSAGAASYSGQSVASIAIIWLVFVATGSAFDVALVGVVQIVAAIGLSLPAGVLVDRYGRKSLMVRSDLIRGIAVAALGAYVILVGFDLAVVLLVSFVITAFSTLFQPAEQAFLPLLLDRDQLGYANGLISSSRYLVQTLANAIGGALVLVTGVALALFYNSLTFLVSALLIYAIVTASPSGPVPTARSSGLRKEIRDGFGWLLHSPSGLLQLTLSATVMNFFVTVFWVFIVVYAVVALRGNSLAYGILIASLTVGFGLGSLLVGRTGSVRYAGKVWIVFGGVLPGFVALGFGFISTIYEAVPIAIGLGLLTGFAGSTWLTAAQMIVPAEMQGRYFALDGMLSWIGVPIAEIVGAVLIGTWGVVLTFELSAVGLLVTGLISILSHRLWALAAPIEPVRGSTGGLP